MCGFTGFWNFKADNTAENLKDIVKKMSDEIIFRGPDSEGQWVDPKVGIAFGHRRLSIVDLSEAGHQPMVSHSGRFIISYNGEIYNTQELKQELIARGCKFKGHSDTEVILEGFEVWGIEETCKKLIGMFAFSLWDSLEKKLFLARDRVGKKPLYWGFKGEVLFFGSQPRSFTPHPNWRSDINREVLSSYFRFNYVPAPLSIYKDIHKLQPGSILSIDKQKQVSEFKFWSLDSVVESNSGKRLEDTSLSDLNTKVNQLEDLLKDSIQRRMIADVPLGAFLSGGIDSSTVVALMQVQSATPIKTFTIGFSETGYNEAPYASAVAKHLKTEHHELYLTSQDACNIIPDIPNWCDEPFADVSQIPTHLVSRLARSHVKVSLSGDGGDELFAGYNRYHLGYSAWSKLRLLPLWLRSLASKSIQGIAPKYWDAVSNIVPKRLRPNLFGDKLHKFSEAMILKDPAHFYKLLVSQWRKPEDLVLNITEPLLPPWNRNQDLSLNFVEYLQYMDLLSYLPDDILAKVDRASMAVSLEARTPLLDHRVIDFAWSLPLNLKIRNGQSKWILRKVLERHLPLELIERPKMGFGVPIDRWLKGPLKDWAQELLCNAKLEENGLNPGPILNYWKEHLSGRRSWAYALWGVLMYQAWREKW